MPAFSFTIIRMINFLPSREVFVHIGMFDIRWYGVMYVVAFGLTAIMLFRLQKWRGLNEDKWFWWEVAAWLAAGAMIGGRLGYMLIYDGADFWRNPITVLWIQNGGMSSHGGVIGVGLALLAVQRWLKPKSLWKIADLIVVPAAIGLALGRYGNFINQELYGTITKLPWGIGIPGVNGLRHPWPIYEAIWLLCLAIIGMRGLRKVKIEGVVVAWFLIEYGAGRLFLEIWREPEWDLVYGLTPGQWWSIAVIIGGMWLWVNRAKTMPKSNSR